MKKALVVGILASWLVSIPARATGYRPPGTCTRPSSVMGPNQVVVLTIPVEISDLLWSGTAFYVIFGTPVSTSMSTVNIRIDRIVKIWHDNAWDWHYDAVRDSYCKRFPCADSHGKIIAHDPISDGTGVGSIVNVDKEMVNNKAQQIKAENLAAQIGDVCQFWNDKGFHF